MPLEVERQDLLSKLGARGSWERVRKGGRSGKRGEWRKICSSIKIKQNKKRTKSYYLQEHRYNVNNHIKLIKPITERQEGTKRIAPCIRPSSKSEVEFLCELWVGSPPLQDPVAVQHSPEVSSCPALSATISLTPVLHDALLSFFPP